MRKAFFMIFLWAAVSSAGATVSLRSDFLSLYNDGETFSYGTETGYSVTFGSGRLSVSNSGSVVSCAGLRVPLGSVTLSSENMSALIYNLGGELRLGVMGAGADFFVVRMLYAPVSASILDFSLAMDRAAGARLRARFSDRLSLDGIFLSCMPEGFYGGKKFGEGELTAAGALSCWTLPLEKVVLDLKGAFAHAYGKFDFNFNLIDGLFTTYSVLGSGDFLVSAAVTGMSVRTLNPRLNIHADFLCAYLISARVSADVRQTVRFVFATRTTLTELRKDFSDILLFPLSVKAEYSPAAFSSRLHISAGKSLVVPVSVSGRNDLSFLRGKSFGDIARIVLLSGISASVRAEL